MTVALPVPRGRPRDPAKREALLDAARTLFLAQGFEAVTMDQILAQARVARATLYAYFPDKPALLEAMVARESERMLSEVWVRDSLSVDPETALVEFGEKLLRFLSDPAMIGLERLIASAARNVPDLADRLFAAGPGRARGILHRILRVAADQGLVSVAEPDVAIADLVGLWQGFFRVELNFGQRLQPSGDELRQRARHGVHQFMRLYAPGANEGATGT
jgi:TetR/AcrR family transcriptional regulator, mexJK operon transcriptional repressor